MFSQFIAFLCILSSDAVAADGGRILVVPYDSISHQVHASVTLRQATTSSDNTSTVSGSHMIDASIYDLLPDEDNFKSVIVHSQHICNILFSSGTTGEPKAIPWYHATPLKSAIDGHLHQVYYFKFCWL